jgi:hypothetical protein
MVMRGETIATGAPSTCPDCGTVLTLEALASGAGWYVGTFCECGPYSRESGYYRTEREAQDVLDSGMFGR